MFPSRRVRALLVNRYGSGRIHVGAIAVPYTMFAAVRRVSKKRGGKKMTLRYCPWSPFVSVVPIVFNGSGTDFATISAPVFPAGAPVPEALAMVQISGVWTVDPGILRARIVDENNDVVCGIPDNPPSGVTPAARCFFALLTGIAGRGGLKIQIAASNACTLTPYAIGSTGLVLWDE